MSKTQPLLVIWWPDSHTQQQAEEAGQVIRVRYEVLSPAGQRLNQGNEQVSKLPKDLPCLLLLDASEVTLLAVKPPAVSGKKLKEALPFLVEPFLLNDPEENLVSIWPDCLDSNANGEQLIAVVAKKRLRDICGLINAHQLPVIGISSEGIVKAKPHSGWLSGNKLWLADGALPPVAIDVNQPGIASALLQKRSQGEPYELPKRDLDDVKTKLANMPTGWVKNDGVGTDQAPGLWTLRSRLLASPAELQKLGLKTRGLSSSGGLNELKRPALLFAIVGLIGLNVLAFKVSQTEEQLEQEINAAYQRVLPNTPMVADPLILIERERRKLNAGVQTTDDSGLPYLLHQAGLALEMAPFNSLQTMKWDGKTLAMGFSATVTPAMQESTLKNIDSSRFVAKWVVGSSNAPNLELKKREGR